MRRALALLLPLFLWACRDEPVAPRAPAPPTQAAAANGDHRGAVPGFYFLSPIAPNLASYPGTFDGSLSPVVEICRWTGTECQTPLVARYTLTEGTGGVKLQVVQAQQHYRVDWPIVSITPGQVVRIRVLLDGAELGHVDAKQPAKNESTSAVAAEGFVPLGNASRLAIRFRAERGVQVGAIALSAPSPNVAPGAVMQMQASVQSRGGAPLAGIPVEWSSSDVAVATVSESGLVAGRSSGLVTITAQSGNVAAQARLSVAPMYSTDSPPMTDSSGETRWFTEAFGGVQFVVTARDQHGAPVSGATVRYGTTGDGRALVIIDGPGDRYLPFVWLGSPTTHLSFPEPLRLAGQGFAHDQMIAAEPISLITVAFIIGGALWSVINYSNEMAPLVQRVEDLQAVIRENPSRCYTVSELLEIGETWLRKDDVHKRHISNMFVEAVVGAGVGAVAKASTKVATLLVNEVGQELAGFALAKGVTATTDWLNAPDYSQEGVRKRLIEEFEINPAAFQPSSRVKVMLDDVIMPTGFGPSVPVVRNFLVTVGDPECSTPHIDLALSKPVLPTQVRRNAHLTAEVELSNLGDLDAGSSGMYTNLVYASLSKDGTDEGVVASSSTTFDGVAAGATRKLPVGLMVPLNVPLGSYYLIVQVQPAWGPEYETANNRIVSTTRVEVTKESS